jgi:outer membrane protein assembly factor BamB
MTLAIGSGAGRDRALAAPNPCFVHYRRAIVTGNRRVTSLVAFLAACAAMVGVLLWLVFSFMPLRASATGPFFAWAQTPERTTLASRRALASSWPMFGGSPARTRFVPSTLRPPLRVRYRVPGGGGLIEMPPAVARGRVVFGTHSGRVVAFDLHNGAVRWVAHLGSCIASSPAVRDGVAYLGWAGPAPCRHAKGEDGGIAALSLATGRVLWRFHTGNVESSPAIVGNGLFFSAFRTRHDSRVYAMRLDQPRRIVWSYPIPSKIASSPALVGRTLYVSAYDRELYAFNAVSGHRLWQSSAFVNSFGVRLLLGVKSLVSKGSWSETGYYATPAVAYRRVYLGTIDGVFTAFDAVTGEPRWSRVLGSSVYGSAAVSHEVVYVGTTNGVFHALSARTGKELWKSDLGAPIYGSATVTNGHVFVATFGRQTSMLNARTGELEWQFPDGRYSSLVVAGREAVLVGKGRIYGLENAPEPVTWRPS